MNPLEGGMAQRLLSQRDELIQVKKTTPWLYHPASWFLSIKSRLNIYKTSLIDVQAGLSNITKVKTIVTAIMIVLSISVIILITTA